MVVLNPFFLLFFFFFFHVSNSSLHTIAFVISGTNLTNDALTLLRLKQELLSPSDSPLKLTSSGWTSETISSVCSWTGVTCSNHGDNSTNVVSGLDFTNFILNGTLTQTVCALHNLTHLLLRFNNFTQPFPLFLLDLCPNLTYLDLSQNWFYGDLPTNISALTKLQYLSLEGNSFTGSIPPDFGSLPKLTLLRLRGNTLEGTIPPELGNLSNLRKLDLAYAFPETSSVYRVIPPELGNLTNLESLDLAGSNFFGSIPSSLGALSHLSMFDLSGNNLTGIVPSSLANLTSIQYFYLYENQLSGPLPRFEHFHDLIDIQMHENNFNGTIPESFTTLTSLYKLQLYNNLLSGTLPLGLESLPNLTTLVLYNNFFWGEISSEWGLHLPGLFQFDVSNNSFSGPLPPHLCHSGTIHYISFMNNGMNGTIPDNYGTECESLTRFVMNGNLLSGSVPSGLWTQPKLDTVMLQNNMLSGNINLSYSWGASGLSVLCIDYNEFEGEIPNDIGKFWNLTKFTASHNKFSGDLPSRITTLTRLENLNLSSNMISGEIPSSINALERLNLLDLSHNNLIGPIPPQLGLLENLNFLDLSFNSLNGTFPDAIVNETTQLSNFNVSYNNLSGIAPKQLVYVFLGSFDGNPLLCHIASCYTTSVGTNKDKKGQTQLKDILAGVLISIGALVLCGAIVRCLCAKRRIKEMKEIDWKVMPFQRLEFSEDKIFERLDEENVIGSGGSGKVYKVSFPKCKTIVAVKKIMCQGPPTKSRNKFIAFSTEMNILGNVKHKNVVKLLCCCVSDETKLLVYEYMPHGSLGDILHKRFETKLTNWETRCRIAIGTAKALSYLHHDCRPSILHRDIKSNNILISWDFEPKLADFGVAKTMDLNTDAKLSYLTRVVGSVGYIAPGNYITTIFSRACAYLYHLDSECSNIKSNSCKLVHFSMSEKVDKFLNANGHH